MGLGRWPVQVAATGDEMAAAGRLLHDFNVEYDDVTPGPAALAARLAALVQRGDTVVVLGGSPPCGVAVLRLRPAIWTLAEEAYLAELYVAPGERGKGLGRALLDRCIAEARNRGADRIELGTSEADVAAIGLYERFGFTNREGGQPDDPVMFVYEREL